MKRIIAILLCILILGSVAAFADDGTALQILGYRQNDNKIDVLLYAKDSQYFTEHNMTARLNNSNLNLEKLSAFSGSGYGTTWLVIVEPTAYSNIRNMNYELLETLVTQLGENDSLAVMDARTGETSSFVKDVPTVKGFAKTALEGRGDVRLYDAVHTAISKLHENAPADSRKNLVILSSCIDSNSVHTLDELYQEVVNSDLTVYTLGLMRNPNVNDDPYQKLSTLSTATPSGLAAKYADYPRGVGATALKLITDNDDNFYVLTASLDGVYEAGEPTLAVTLNGVEATVESIPVYVVMRNDGYTPATGGVQDEEELSENEGNTNTFLLWVKNNLLVVILAAVLLILMVVLLIVLLRKNKRKTIDRDVPIDGDDIPDIPTGPVSKVRVELTNRANGTVHAGEIFDSSIKAGRSAELKLVGDPSISREQMEFIWQNGILYVQDTNSSNGTLVNGKEVVGAVHLQQGDMIHVGDTDYVVTWRSRQ